MAVVAAAVFVAAVVRVLDFFFWLESKWLGFVVWSVAYTVLTPTHGTFPRTR